MRPILALAMVLLGLNGAVPDSKFQDSILVVDADSFSTPIESEVIGKADREIVFVPADESIDETHEQQAGAAEPLHFWALASAEIDTDEGAAADSVDDLCNSLLTSAQSNDLPVPFFANLIWQESRLRHDAISKVGALGIAQFMPEVAVAAGVDNPFDARQAIPASARLLHRLREQFGNLGLVAAAYNAGARRVSEWLDHGRALPHETLTYVVRVTGRSVEQWRKTPPEDSTLTFVRPLPCRELPAFADLEQQAQLQQAQSRQAQAQQVQLQEVQRVPRVKEAALSAHRPVHNHKDAREPVRLERFRKLTHDWHSGRRGFTRHQHTVHARRREAHAGRVIAERTILQVFPDPLLAPWTVSFRTARASLV